MASIISAGTTSTTAIAISGDTTGNLAFKTSAGAYTQTMPNVTGNIVTTGDTGTVTKTMVSTSTSTGFGLCRAWVNFAGSNAAINASYNVSSITKVTTGTYAISFTTAMPNASYSFAGSGQRLSTDDAHTLIVVAARNVTLTTSGLTIFTGTQTAIAIDPLLVTLAVFSS